jgi:CheY-like chemotaxis protein
MKTIIEQAEEQLIALLTRLKAEPGTSGCLHIRGAALTERNFQALPPAITQWIGEHEDGRIIIAHDKDIFVFAPNVTFKLFLKFRDTLAERFEGDPGLRDEGIVSFYDVRINGTGLMEIAKAKLERKLAARRRAEDIEKARQKTRRREDILQEPLNAEWIQTLGRRRHDRHAINVLVVEDDPFSRRLVDVSLSTTPYSTQFATDGRSAILNHLKAAPDIVFLDIDLPDITGHDVLGKILELDPGAYVVMLSGNGNAENVTKAVKAGAKGFVAKPFTKEKLLHYIGRCNNEKFQDH